MRRQERSRPARRFGPLESLETRALMTMVATAPLLDQTVAPGATVSPIDLDAHFKDAAASTDYAMVNTSLGTIPVLLTPQTTPLTVANFLSYVTKGDYTNTVVHRSVPGFIWQTGGYQLPTSGTNLTTIPASAPVQNEFGASNVRGTIAMAKLGSDPNSATSQFFFNESDSNAANLDNQNGGFTVFGHVVGPAGLAVMDAVAAVPVPSPGPLPSPLDQIPLQNYTAGATVQPANLVLVKSVTTANELYTTASDTPGVATATIQGSDLTINPIAPGTAHILVLAYGSDGVPVSESFTVTVPATPGSPTPTPIPTPTPTATTPTATPPTSTSTGTPTLVVPPASVAPPASVLVPSARGSLPASVVAGRKAKLQQTVTLTDPAGPVAQKERVALSLSGALGESTNLVFASTTTKVKLKAGKQVKLTLGANHLNAGTPAGTYHVLVSVTDPNGASTTVDTGKTLVVKAPATK